MVRASLARFDVYLLYPTFACGDMGLSQMHAMLLRVQNLSAIDVGVATGLRQRSPSDEVPLLAVIPCCT